MMASTNWKKVENEAGYPSYVDESTGKQQYDHPQFQQLVKSLQEFDGIKYGVYRIAFKLFVLQKELRVPPLRISSGVFARHQLSLSESSLSLDTTELEAVLADIYFAAQKEGLYTGDVDLTVDLVINLLLNVFDKERKEPVRVLAAKTLLIVLSEETVCDKWAALANCCADHNGCVSPKRLAALLSHIAAIPQYLGSNIGVEHLQADVDACFDKSAGMLGAPSGTISEWAVSSCAGTRWLSTLSRIAASRNAAAPGISCAACLHPLIQVLKFKCSKCTEVYFCEKCYLYGKDLTNMPGHKKSHLVQEIIDGEPHPSECISFIKTMRRFFFCTKTKKKVKKTTKKSVKENTTMRRKIEGRPAMFTSTVGKASGHVANNPTTMLQDIISQLEVQSRALKELSAQLELAAKADDDGLKVKVDTHYNQISTQIHRLKIVKDNLTQTTPAISTEATTIDKTDRPQAFDLFSPILVEDKQSKVTESIKNQPRVLSLDSGNFSVVSKQMDSQNLLTVSGDAFKPVVHTTTDSISTVSMNDISNWYNEPATTRLSASLSATQKQYAVELSQVEAGDRRVAALSQDLDVVLDRLQQILQLNFAVDESSFDNTQLRETANEMEGLLGTLIRGVEQRATLKGAKSLV